MNLSYQFLNDKVSKFVFDQFLENTITVSLVFQIFCHNFFQIGPRVSNEGLYYIGRIFIRWEAKKILFE